MCGNPWYWREKSLFNSKKGMGEGWFEAAANAKGRPRKPLAEVLLGAPRCAPLRLILTNAHGVPFRKLLITLKDSGGDVVGIALGWERFTSGRKSCDQEGQRTVENQAPKLGAFAAVA
jgi:hypothetical protein